MPIPNGVFAENCYLVIDERAGECAIVDPGEEAGLILHKVRASGARPVAILNSLRFGALEDARTRFLLGGVVGGIGHYGNCFGCPTVGGEISFDAGSESAANVIALRPVPVTAQAI